MITRVRLPQLTLPLRQLPFAFVFGEASIAILQIRQMSSQLDTWLALALALGGFLYCRLPDADAGAPAGVAMLVALALSTQTQVLFGRDGPGGVDRLRLWPFPGWRILAAKDLGVLAVAMALAAPLDGIVGLSAMLASLTIGHPASVSASSFQRRWRCTSGRPILTGLLQISAIFAVRNWSQESGATVLPALAGAWAVSLAVSGWMWDWRTAPRKTPRL